MRKVPPPMQQQKDHQKSQDYSQLDKNFKFKKEKEKKKDHNLNRKQWRVPAS